MNFIDKLRNHKLRFKEKFSNLYSKQLLRSGKILANRQLKQGLYEISQPGVFKGVLECLLKQFYDARNF